MNYKGLIIRYGEIALKGKNRPQFEDTLLNNIKATLKINKLTNHDLKKKWGYIVLNFKKEQEITPYLNALKKVFGIYSISPFISSGKDIDEIKIKSLELLNYENKKTFKVKTKRTDKSFYLNSMELNAKIGEYLLKNSESRVDIKNPETIININITKEKAYIYTKTYKAYGGLPLGTQGKVVCLISGGIDSPVAAWNVMKRGAEVILLNIYTDKENIRKIEEIKRKLEEYTSGREIKLIEIARKDIFNGFENTQLNEKDKKTAVKYTCLFCKNNMMKIAEKYAEKYNAKAIVMGDNLGQVASQTLDNIYVARSGINIPVLSPLLTYEKQDIINIAKEIGTYDISIKEDYECPLRPKNPITRASLKVFKELKNKARI